MTDQMLPPPLASDERFALLCQLLDDSLAGIDLTPMLVYLVDTVSAELLPTLAEQFSLLDETTWSGAESEAARRELIKGAVGLHRYKGTPWSLRDMCRRLGLGEIQISEGLAAGLETWAQYAILLPNPITNDMAARVRRALIETAPARCRLARLDYQAVALRHNGRIRRDGQYNRGSA
ncbi:phage tail protein [Stutzerimonas kirkiae]|nr:phage tail protein [Stutzerimonas kirkiae]